MPQNKFEPKLMGYQPYRVFLMTDLNNQNDGDATADAIATIAVVLIIVTGVIYWLSTL